MDNTGWMPLLNSEASSPGMMTAQDWQAAQGILLEPGFMSESIGASFICWALSMKFTNSRACTES
jgi:hypothetical protein